MSASGGLKSRVRMFRLLVSASLLTAFVDAETTWTEVQQKPDYLAAKKQIADFLPDLAERRIKDLLKISDLDATAKSHLLTLLGEAQVRGNLAGEALKTLDDPALRDFSPAHQWRSYALARLGRYRDALSELEKIDRVSMLPEARLQTGKLQLALRDLEGARASLEPLLKSKNDALVREARLQLISLSLAARKPDEAAKLIASFTPTNPAEQSLASYLNGRIQLMRGERLAAIDTFQKLVSDPEDKKNLPSDLFHEATLALVDSLALEGNENAAATAVLSTLEQYPDSPKLPLFFARLRQWRDRLEITPVLEKLSTWLPALPPPPDFPTIAPGSSAANLPLSLPETIPPPRSLLALEFTATQALRAETAESRMKGRLQATLLLLLSDPGSPSVNRTLLELGNLKLKTGEYRDAFQLFSILQEIKTTPFLRAYAKALAAKASFALKEPTKASQLFREAGEIAREARQADLASTAALNAGIALLTTPQSKELGEVTNTLDRPEARAFLILERGLHLASQNNPSARDFLSRYLANFPNTPRTAEASLALAESAIFTTPFDTSLAAAQTANLRFDPATQPLLEGRRLLVILALGSNIEQAGDFVTRFPKHPLADRILFQLGQAYRNPPSEEDIEPGKANLQFERLIENYPQSPFVEAAKFYSALTAASLKTESADTNAVKRFRQVMEGEGVLANEAAISLCSFLIDQNQEDTALFEINRLLEKNNLPAADRRRLNILGADASNQKEEHEAALKYYQNLLAMKDLPVATRHRANFIKGQTLEKLNRPVEAHEAYNAVINREFDPAQTTSLEWKWFNKCAIEGALALLEQQERWPAAIQLAEKIAQSGSPRAKDAQQIADRLSLEHFIYRERSSEEGR
jgi:outer membrane protein assembly factor BamD (BamD/ComL family)